MSEPTQRDVREAISESDELSRRAHELHQSGVAQRLEGLRTALMSVDQALGGGDLVVSVSSEVGRIAEELAHLSATVPASLRARFDDLVADARALPLEIKREMAPFAGGRALRSKPLLGTLPLARVVSQDVHSITDYVHAAGCLTTAIFARSTAAQIGGAVLGASMASVSAVTDCRLSVARVIPIETHEAIDYVWGLAAIAAPFALGYYKRDRIASALHVFFGLGTIVTSLMTDYRAADGAGRDPRELAGENGRPTRS